MEPNNKYAAAKPLYRLTRFVWFVVAIIESLLAFRFFLRLFAANPNAPFTAFIYGITAALADPFLNVFGITRVQGSVFEWTTILAMFVYWLIGWAIIKLAVISRPVSKGEAREKLIEKDR